MPPEPPHGSLFDPSLQSSGSEKSLRSSGSEKSPRTPGSEKSSRPANPANARLTPTAVRKLTGVKVKRVEPLREPVKHVFTHRVWML